MKDFVNSSALTKLLANVFVFVVLIASVGIAVYDALTIQTINPYVSTLIGGGLTYAVGLLGFHVGGVQALQAQSQLQQIPPTATVPISVQAVIPPVDPEATQQRPAVTLIPGSQTRSTNATGASPRG